MEKDDEKFLLYKMLMAFAGNGCSSTSLYQYKNKDDLIYIDMPRSQDYTDELEKINRDDSGLALTITLKKAAAKKIKIQNYWLVARRVLVYII